MVHGEQHDGQSTKSKSPYDDPTITPQEEPAGHLGYYPEGEERLGSTGDIVGYTNRKIAAHEAKMRRRQPRKGPLRSG